MIAVRRADVVTVCDNVADALAGFSGGYSVRLHGRPGIEFVVRAGSVDEAHRIALAASELKAQSVMLTGATIQAR